jgi:hypothetical protein
MAPFGYIVFKVVQEFSDILKQEQVGKKAKDFLAGRTSLLSSWWSCLRKRCDYYEVYQAFGPADLTHNGYHAAERLALEHRANCTIRGERECETCQGWSDRLRGEVWELLMASKTRTEKQFGFHPTNSGGTR